MIVSYRDRRTENFARGTRVKAFEPFRRQAEKVLDRLEAATSLVDLLSFPGMRLEKLKGDRAGQYSVRINDKWRVCFEWASGASDPSNVEIVDYH
jgi:toxin HigB-1